MSLDLHNAAMKSALMPNLKLVLVALCDAAGQDDGTDCHPSTAYLMYKTGFSERQIRRFLRAFEQRQWIKRVAWLQGGRGHTTEYRIFMENVPMMRAWRDVKRELIAEGKLEPDPPLEGDAPRPDKKHARGLKGDILTPFVERPVKGDILTPFSPVKGDILTPFSPVKGDILTPIVNGKNKKLRETEETALGAPDAPNSIEMASADNAATAHTPPPPPLPRGAALGAPIEERKAQALWGQVKRRLALELPAAQVASWITPARLTACGWTEDGGFAVTLAAPGASQARLLDERYGDQLRAAIGAAVSRTPGEVQLRVVAA